jgi:hypothetical protein
LFVTGSEIAWDLDQQNNGRTFFENTLKGDFVADGSGAYAVAPTAAGIFAGLPNFSFSNGASFSNLINQVYNVNSADVINPQTSAQTALNYSGGIGGSAAIQAPGVAGAGSLVMFGFPFESITSAANRTLVMGRVLNFFGVAPPTAPTADFDEDGDVDGADFLAWQIGLGSTGAAATRANGNADGDVNVDAADLAVWNGQFGATSAIAAAATLDVDDAGSVVAVSNAEDSATTLAAIAQAHQLATFNPPPWKGWEQPSTADPQSAERRAVVASRRYVVATVDATSDAEILTSCRALCKRMPTDDAPPQESEHALVDFVFEDLAAHCWLVR